MRLTPADLAARVQPLLAEAGLWRESFAGAEREWFLRVLELLQPRAKKLGQFVDEAGRSSLTRSRSTTRR